MILSIESSCDDSSIAITEIATKALRFHKKISQDSEHTVYGGVVPELASRLHAVALPRILEEARPCFSDLKAIAVTHEPGLSVTLMEGVMMAKALALTLKLPVIAVNHLLGHVFSLFIEKEAQFPLSILLVSGGHTMILEARSAFDLKLIGRSLDDSFGESFDKVAKMLNLGYPGGPIVESRAKEGDSGKFAFPIPMQKTSEVVFSFSGLKNAVRLEVEKLENPTDQDVNDICAGFQKTATAHLLQKCKKYFKQTHPKRFAIVGGASANLYLRQEIESLCWSFNCELLLAPLAFCSDNAAMIGRAAIPFFENERFTSLHQLEASPKNSLF